MTQPGDPPSALEQRGTELGITFRRGRTWTSNSHLAFEAQEFAAEHEQPGDDPLAFHRVMFKAYFDDLEDIGSIDNLVRIGGRAGLPETELREALESGRYRQQVDDGIRWSREIGVSAVPTFVIDEKYGIVGAQDQLVFEDLLQRAGHRRKDA